MSEMLDRALDLLRSGQRVEGEMLLVSAARDSSRTAGDGSVAHAAALFDLAQWLLVAGERERALEPLRKAAALPATDPESTRARLTYGMNLGEVLQVCGKFEEALDLLRQNVATRGRFYGEDSEGLAWGLEPLASVLLALGRVDEAAAEARRALDILWRAGSARTAHALALVASARAACGSRPPYAPEVEALPDDLRAETLQGALLRLQLGPIEPALAVASELAARGEGPVGVRAAAWTQIERAAARARQHETRLAACRSYIELQRAAGHSAEVIDGTQGLAQALEDAGRLAEASAAWADAVRLARGQGDPAALSGVLRNHGLFMADRKADGWEDLLAEAIRTAESVPGPRGPELGAKARGALGVRLQHSGDTLRAERLLAEALAIAEDALHPADGDLITIRTHLAALRTAKSCGCGEEEQRMAIARALEDLARPHLPEGLLGRVELSPSGDIAVHLTRAATSDEADLVNRALRQAQAEIRARNR